MRGLKGPGRLFRPGWRDEEGSQLVEVAVAALVMAVAVTGLIGTMASGFTLVGHSRQRSSGSNVALERLERARDLPFDNVALTNVPPADPLPAGETALPAYKADETHPNHDVLPAIEGEPGVSYVVDGSTAEPLVIAADGILHVDDPVTVGGTEFSVHQYVTWVDDPGIEGTQDYKRVTVVVTWKFPVRSGTAHQVAHSTFVSQAAIGTISTPTPAPTGSSPPAPSPTPAPSGSPTPTPVPTGSCSGDTTPPSSTLLEMLSGAGAQQGYTNSTTLQIRLTATDGCAPLVADLSNDGVNYTLGVAALESGNPGTVAWTIPSGDGSKTVYARFRDGAGNTSAALTASVILDQAVPTIPGDLRKVNCSMSGSDRTVSLTWNSSTDANFQGYRLYRSIDSSAFDPISTTTTLSGGNTHKKNPNSVRFIVRSYDKAGNESGDSNIRTFQKNSCA